MALGHMATPLTYYSGDHKCLRQGTLEHPQHLAASHHNRQCIENRMIGGGMMVVPGHYSRIFGIGLALVPNCRLGMGCLEGATA
jgi:hypothetical protein